MQSSLSSPDTPCFLPALKQACWQGQQPAQNPAPNHWQDHCRLPDSNSHFPRNLSGKLVAAVPMPPLLLVSPAVLSEIAEWLSCLCLGWYHIPPCRERREEVLEGALKVREERKEGVGGKTHPHNQCQR